MPFQSKSQMRACWAQYNREVSAGKTPAWDCHKWAKETEDTKDLPDYKYEVTQGANYDSDSSDDNGMQGAGHYGQGARGRSLGARGSGSRQGARGGRQGARGSGSRQGARTSGAKKSGCRGFQCLSATRRRAIAKKGGSSPHRTRGRKSGAKASNGRRSPARKSAGRKSAGRKSGAKKSNGRRSPARKSAGRRSAGRQARDKFGRFVSRR